MLYSSYTSRLFIADFELLAAFQEYVNDSDYQLKQDQCFFINRVTEIIPSKFDIKPDPRLSSFHRVKYAETAMQHVPYKKVFLKISKNSTPKYL